jgi:GH43 family beta-xylosidase
MSLMRRGPGFLRRNARLLCAALFHVAAAFAQSQSTFTNPLLPSGPDPWVTYDHGFYYYMNTTGVNLTLWKTRNIGDLGTAEKKVVWTPPAQGPYSHDIWAPEIHRLGGKWYIYFAADSGTNQTHRLWVIENGSRDPLQGQWTFKGKLADATDKWAIDGSVFRNRGKLYLIWSGWEGDQDGTQNIYIARLKNPWTIGSERVRISTPELPWETVGDIVSKQTGQTRHVNVNEGPEALTHGGNVYLVYSASGCWTDHYTLGMLTAKDGADLLHASSWKKNPQPVFTESPAAHAYGTGHNGFFQSPDGKQNWIIYHANPEPHEGCGANRSPRAQPFDWNADGSPNFGTPVPVGQPLPKPSGGR